MNDRGPDRGVDPNLFGFAGRVGRRTYFVTGVWLMALKVAVDVALVRVALGRWTIPPFAFDLAHVFSREATASGPGWTQFAIVAWSVPFLWIGTAMSARRAADAGRSRALAVAFLVPIVNYLLIAFLCLAPARTAADAALAAAERDAEPGSAFVAGATASAFAALLLLVCVFAFGSYGAALFIGTPVVFGAVCAYLANRPARRSLRATLGIAFGWLAILHVALLAFALEGAVCLLMAAPITFALAGMGVLLGRSMTGSAFCARDAGPVALLCPALLAADAFAPPPAPHEVVSSVEIDAPPETVWRNVVTFGDIGGEPPLLFRTGLACPQRARIEGRGVGAVRYCEFTTGPFVEPITVWDEPRRLAFDVASEPAPLVEWSPYSHVHAPHLDGWFRSLRGEFRLVPLVGGRTRLEGSTWYALDVAPRAYWQLWADGLVHGIHLRVLEHVKRLSESER